MYGIALYCKDTNGGGEVVMVIVIAVPEIWRGTIQNMESLVHLSFDNSLALYEARRKYI